MKKHVIYKIMGSPVPMSRPRFGKSNVWDPQREFKHAVKVSLEKQRGIRPVLDKPLKVYVTFFMKTPKRSKRDGQFCFGRPDIDNLLKMVFDCSNNILIVDDRLIVECEAKKIYDSEPRSEFYFEEVENYEKKSKKGTSVKGKSVENTNVETK